MPADLQGTYSNLLLIKLFFFFFPSLKYHLHLRTFTSSMGAISFLVFRTWPRQQLPMACHASQLVYCGSASSYFLHPYHCQMAMAHLKSLICYQLSSFHAGRPRTNVLVCPPCSPSLIFLCDAFVAVASPPPWMFPSLPIQIAESLLNSTCLCLCVCFAVWLRFQTKTSVQYVSWHCPHSETNKCQRRTENQNPQQELSLLLK